MNQIFDNNNNNNPLDMAAGVSSATMSKSFISNVMSYMCAALAVSGIMAYWFGTTPELLQYLINMETGGFTILGWITMFAPLGLVLLMGFAYQRLSSIGLLSVFILYSLVTGMSLSFIFVAYTSAAISTTFFITAATFGVMAVLGYTTNTDLTKMGSILTMALIGLVIAMVINMFLQSSAWDYIISGIGVLLFTGLTAYDVQKLKRLGAQVEGNSEEGSKMALMGALTLYLDFINLFLFMLRFFGGSRD